jgi:hypothetical protein
MTINASVVSNEVRPTHPRRAFIVAVATTVLLLCAGSAWASVAGAETVTYAATQTMPVPPASTFAGSGGGDGWAVALSETAVYNVFHHQPTLQVACHLQANAQACFAPETIKDGEGHNFAVSGQPGLYVDRSTGKIYVYATRTSDKTAGVVCIDSTIATTNPDPFCGFTALTPVGEAPTVSSGISGASAPMLIGHHWYAFNFVTAVGHSGVKNSLMCFDVSTDEACGGQPYSVALGAGNVTDGGFPSPATAAIGSKVVIPMSIGGTNRLACFDDATGASCAGSWPVSLGGVSYASVDGAPFPLLEASGKIGGFCIPTGADQCFNLAGETTSTPSGMTAVIGASSPWNGPALTLGPRVYVPNGNANSIQCFDYATNASCSGFPKVYTEPALGYLYTINADPQRPTCFWVNADSGTHQIQNFDAYTGLACGQGAVRALAAQFVVPSPQCTPISYVSVQVLQPARSEYTTGGLTFNDGDGNAIAGLPEAALDESGSASLKGLELNTPTGLPQFLFTLQGGSGALGAVTVKLTWTGTYSSECVGAHTTVALAPSPGGGQASPPSTAAATRPTTAPATVVVELPCSVTSLQLTDVTAVGRRVRLIGQAPLSLVGHSVAIRFLATGLIVGTAIVQPDGSFQTTAPLPPMNVRRTNAARYQASAGSLKSLTLKLFRRMSMSTVRLLGGRLHVSGSVAGSFKPGTHVYLLVRVHCTSETLIGRAVLGKGGRFTASLVLPAGLEDPRTTFRAMTNVLLDGQRERTYTLPTPPRP